MIIFGVVEGLYIRKDKEKEGGTSDVEQTKQKP
jgi:hypothetical protein